MNFTIRLSSRLNRFLISLEKCDRRRSSMSIMKTPIINALKKNTITINTDDEPKRLVLYIYTLYGISRLLFTISVFQYFNLNDLSEILRFRQCAISIKQDAAVSCTHCTQYTI